VLLVEDDPGDIVLITEALQAMDVPRQVDVVRDGLEMLDFLFRRGDYAEAPRPDLVLLDLRMPRMDGRQALSVMKADQSLRLIPVVVLTTSRDDNDISAIYEQHANAYVTKPADAASLWAAVQGIDDFFTRVAMRPPPLATG
jgi:CheY-like chemotaxis protein